MPRFKKELNERQLEFLDYVVDKSAHEDEKGRNRRAYHRLNSVYLNTIRINELNEQVRLEKDRNKAYELLEQINKLEEENKPNLEYGNREISKMISENDGYDHADADYIFNYIEEYINNGFSLSLFVGDREDPAYDLSVENILDEYHTRVETIKSLVNRPTNNGFFDFKQPPLQDSLLGRIKRFDKKHLNKVKNYKVDDKAKLQEFALNLPTSQIKKYVDNLKTKYFDPKVELTAKVTYNKLNAENIRQYADKIKELQELVSKKPWYKKIFNDKHNADLAEIERAKQMLIENGVDKKALDKYLNASPKKANDKFKELMDKSKPGIERFNNEFGREVSSIKVNLEKNPTKEEIDAKASKTLDKVVDKDYNFEEELEHADITNEVVDFGDDFEKDDAEALKELGIEIEKKKQSKEQYEIDLSFSDDDISKGK